MVVRHLSLERVFVCKLHRHYLLLIIFRLSLLALYYLKSYRVNNEYLSFDSTLSSSELVVLPSFVRTCHLTADCPSYNIEVHPDPDFHN